MSASARAFCWSAARLAPAALPVHLVFMLAAFQSSDLRSTGTIISQAVVLSVAMVPLATAVAHAGRLEVAVFAVALLFSSSGLATWTIASQPLLATTQVRAWACWLPLLSPRCRGARGASGCRFCGCRRWRRSSSFAAGTPHGGMEKERRCPRSAFGAAVSAGAAYRHPGRVRWLLLPAWCWRCCWPLTF
ncbi:hypothetical protein HS125_17050 [bacterium]|nr:hypothetical protein [bacterium]